MRSSSAILLGAIDFRKDSERTLQRQLYEALQDAILSGRVPTGRRLPSSRALADNLEVSRNTVISAYEKLTMEGYLETRVGSGTFVSNKLPDHLLSVHPGENPAPNAEQLSASRSEIKAELSQRGQAVMHLERNILKSRNRASAFRPGVPALDAFPFTTWRRLTNRRWKSMAPARLAYGSSAGFLPLREQIAEYLAAARGVHCTPEQIIIVSGTQQALSLASRVLVDPGDPVMMEDPGYPRARGAFVAAGARLISIPIDEEGLQVASCREHDDARMAYVTPSHQYPLGVTMSLRRRLELLDWAEREQVWILEDDYDSEYRYTGSPIPALQGLDQSQRVLYIGTFSKVLFPALRLGYMVVPNMLVDAFVAARSMADRCPPLLNQMVLTDFLREQHFERHIRRMRTLYESRQEAFVQSVRKYADEHITLSDPKAGLHIVGWLDPDLDAKAVARKLAENDIESFPITRYLMHESRGPALIMGYAAYDEETIEQKVREINCILS